MKMIKLKELIVLTKWQIIITNIKTKYQNIQFKEDTHKKKTIKNEKEKNSRMLHLMRYHLCYHIFRSTMARFN